MRIDFRFILVPMTRLQYNIRRFAINILDLLVELIVRLITGLYLDYVNARHFVTAAIATKKNNENQNPQMTQNQKVSNAIEMIGKILLFGYAYLLWFIIKMSIYCCGFAILFAVAAGIFIGTVIGVLLRAFVKLIFRVSILLALFFAFTFLLNTMANTPAIVESIPAIVEMQEFVNEKANVAMEYTVDIVESGEELFLNFWNKPLTDDVDGLERQAMHMRDALINSHNALVKCATGEDVATK